MEKPASGAQRVNGTYPRRLGALLLLVMVGLPLVVLAQEAKGGRGSPFDGVWPRTARKHTDCTFSAQSDITFSTDAAGVTRAASDALGETRGKVDGKSYVFEYGLKNGVATGKGTFTLANGCWGSFTGTFSDVNGHRGSWSGQRAGSPFDGKWPRTRRQHSDCGYAAESDITFSTDASGVTSAESDALGTARGRVEGNTYVFDYGIVNGVAAGSGTFTLQENGCRTFTGTFSDKGGHKGSWTGTR
jgi:hypothetical protein